MKVKNINGTSDNTCNCGSWLAHWRKFTKVLLHPVLGKNCSEKSCGNKAEVGAHVQKSNHFDNNWYIVPLCKMHNAQREELDLNDFTELVSANKSETCG